MDVALDHPAVSLRHAKVFRRGDVTFVQDLGSLSGTFIDGQRIWTEAELRRGSVLSVGPVAFEYDGHRLDRSRGAGRRASLACVGIRVSLGPPPGRGPRITLLDGVSLAILPGELLCLIGPSGCGKTTLLSVMSGRRHPDAGDVFARGTNLRSDFGVLKRDLAVVTQHEALHPSLTVRQTLFFSMALRIADATSRMELRQRVDQLLHDVGLHERGDVRVRNLSGGQLKRLSLANEIAHRPGIAFLDEVTSGLDELADLEIMTLARDLADQGLAVACITHNTLNIERTAHRIVVLAPEGRLACCGTTSEVCRYFGVERVGDIYEALAARSSSEWQARFRRSPMWDAHVGQWLPDNQPPVSQAQVAHAVSTGDDLGAHVTAVPGPACFLRQFALLTWRMGVMQTMDVRPLAMAVTQAVFVAVLLVVFFGDLAREQDPVTRTAHCRNAAFLLVVSAFWLGCNNAAPEVARERRLYEQERSVFLRVAPYYCSKLVVLGGVAIVQSLVVFLVLSTLSHLPGDGGVMGSVRQSVVVAGTGLLGTMVGLAVSSCARTEQVATRAVPLLMIPQIVLSDVISPLSGWLSWLAPAVTTTYWVFRAFTADTEAYGAKPGDQPPLVELQMLLLHAGLAATAAMIGLGRRAADPASR